MDEKEQLDQFLKSLISKKENVVHELMNDISISTKNSIAFSKIIEAVNSGKKINDDKFKKAVAVAIKKQCEIQTRVLYLVQVLISSNDFDTQVRRLKMKLDPDKGSEILSEMLRDIMEGK